MPQIASEIASEWKLFMEKHEQRTQNWKICYWNSKSGKTIIRNETGVHVVVDYLWNVQMLAYNLKI